MKTMPRITLKAMRFLVERMMTHIQKWEDDHAEAEDYRMSYLNSGLWQASQSMREILDGEFNPLRRNEQVGTVGKVWRTDQQLGEHYAAHLLRDAPFPTRPVD